MALSVSVSPRPRSGLLWFSLGKEDRFLLLRCHEKKKSQTHCPPANPRIGDVVKTVRARTELLFLVLGKIWLVAGWSAEEYICTQSDTIISRKKASIFG